MRTSFPGHFNRAPAKFWESALIVLDANVLLNLYRYSDATRMEFFKALEAARERLWLPYRAAEEYLKNRPSVIAGQAKTYDDMVRVIDEFDEGLSGAEADAYRHPYFTEQTLDAVRNALSEFKRDLSSRSENHWAWLTDDGIKDHIADLFQGKVGESYPISRLEEIIRLGRERYINQIPPGYSDDGKAKDGDSFLAQLDRYGDLIIWHQILDKARCGSHDVVLVTDDRKADWWQIQSGKTLGPRPELIREFADETQRAFYMYRSGRFMQVTADSTDRELDEAALDEVETVSSSELRSSWSHIYQFVGPHVEAPSTEGDDDQKALALYAQMLSDYRQQLAETSEEIKQLTHLASGDVESDSRAHLADRLVELEHQRKSAKQMIEVLQRRIQQSHNGKEQATRRRPTALETFERLLDDAGRHDDH